MLRLLIIVNKPVNIGAVAVRENLYHHTLNGKSQQTKPFHMKTGVDILPLKTVAAQLKRYNANKRR